MGKLTFVFNNEKLRSAGKTEDEMLQPMRVYSRDNGIKETSNWVFELNSDSAFALLGGFVADITDEDRSFVTFLEKWTLEINGTTDDCIQDTLEWYKEEGIAI